MTAEDATAACSSFGRQFQSYGSVLEIRAGSPDLLDTLTARLPPFACPTSSSGDPDLRMYLRDKGPCGCGESHADPVLFRWGAQATGSIDDLLALYHQNVKFYVAGRASGRLFVHAGVVGWRGRTILIPGMSMSGKTNLTVALVDAGATYYSDEYAVIDRHGLVHPYPQDLGLRQPTEPTQHLASAASLGWVAGSMPLPVGLVVVTSYRPGSTWRGRPLSRARGMLDLIRHAVQHVRHPDRVLTYIGTAIAPAVCVTGVRGEAIDTARRILARVP